MIFNAPSGRVYQRDTDKIEVTSSNRPDENWTFTDSAGHEHFWLFDGKRGRYTTTAKSEVPTVVWVSDRNEVDYYEEDYEPHDVGYHECSGHYECRLCGALVEPGGKPDNTRVFIPGLSSYYIDGESVSKEKFYAEIATEVTL